MSSHPVVRGQPWVIPVAVSDANGEAVDISDWTISATLVIPHSSETFAAPTIEEISFAEGTFNFIVPEDAPAQTALPEGQRSLLEITFVTDAGAKDVRSVWLNVRVAEHYAVESADGSATLEA